MLQAVRPVFTGAVPFQRLICFRFQNAVRDAAPFHLSNHLNEHNLCAAPQSFVGILGNQAQTGSLCMWPLLEHVYLQS